MHAVCSVLMYLWQRLIVLYFTDVLDGYLKTDFRLTNEILIYTMFFYFSHFSGHCQCRFMPVFGLCKTSSRAGLLVQHGGPELWLRFPNYALDSGGKAGATNKLDHAGLHVGDGRGRHEYCLWAKGRGRRVVELQVGTIT